MPERVIWVFFYGSYMKRSVLAEVGLVPATFEVGRLSGFDIEIRPLANLVPSNQHSVYGMLATATHDELERLYTHAAQVLGGRYLPEAVVVETRDGGLRAALCYIAPALDAAPPRAEYVDRIVAAAREYAFPDWYIARLESFHP